MSCCASGRVDLDYLARLTDAGWLVVDAPGTPSDGLYARDDAGPPLAVDAATGARSARRSRSPGPGSAACATLPDGRRARTGVRAAGGALSRRATTRPKP